jgi:hypothetical protein
MDLREMALQVWIGFIRLRIGKQWRDMIKVVMKIGITSLAGKFLSSRLQIIARLYLSNNQQTLLRAIILQKKATTHLGG